MDERTKNEIREAVTEAFAASVQDKRYIDVSRIPLICQSIVGIDEKLNKLVTQAEFWPVKTLVYGIVSLMLSATIGALLMAVIRH